MSEKVRISRRKNKGGGGGGGGAAVRFWVCEWRCGSGVMGDGRVDGEVEEMRSSGFFAGWSDGLMDAR